jgi:hypothetical protein
MASLRSAGDEPFGADVEDTEKAQLMASLRSAGDEPFGADVEDTEKALGFA